MRLTLAALIALLLLPAASQAGEPKPTEAGATFLTTVVRELFLGQYDRMWETLYPAQKKLAPIDRFISCYEKDAALIGQLKRLTVLDAYLAPRQKVPGTLVSARPVAVTFKIERSGLGPSTETDTFHAFRVAGTWRWTLPADSIAAFKGGHCL
jgi:hypothetical protein